MALSSTHRPLATSRWLAPGLPIPPTAGHCAALENGRITRLCNSSSAVLTDLVRGHPNHRNRRCRNPLGRSGAGNNLPGVARKPAHHRHAAGLGLDHRQPGNMVGCWNRHGHCPRRLERLHGAYRAEPQETAHSTWVHRLGGRPGHRRNVPRSVVGLFLGFGVGLLVGEYPRRRYLAEALRASGSALKAMGVGMLWNWVRGIGFIGVDDRRHRSLQYALTPFVRPGTARGRPGPQPPVSLPTVLPVFGGCPTMGQ